jgi:tetratricopeptide (TPR) repeat protein
MKILSFVLMAGVLAGCSSQPSSTPPEESTAGPATISITSKSPEAVAHFEKGEMLLDNLRTTEAAEAFAQALKLDPDFALARAWHGLATPGAEGLEELEGAAAAAASLPEAERTLIQGLVANRRGEIAEAAAAFTRVTELAPEDWRGHYQRGQILMAQEKFDDAAAAFKRATTLNPKAGGAQNLLGYAALRQRDTDEAIAAFTEYASILPQEPNAQDSLGEALLASGRFKDAEAAFQKALDVSPQFWPAHQGMAYARFYAGDWAGGRDALGKAKAGASRPVDRIGVDQDLAAAAAAQKNTAEALGIIDASEKTEGAQPSDMAFLPLRRAMTLSLANRGREALGPIAAALEAAEGGQLPPGLAQNLRREALRARIAVEAQLGDKAAVQATSAALDELAASRPEDAAAQTAMHYGRGQLAMLQGDVAGARGHFDLCSRDDELCKWQGVLAAEKVGDKAGAETAREALLKMYLRDPVHLIVRSRLAPVRPT